MTLEEFLRELEEDYNLLSSIKIKISLPTEIKEYEIVLRNENIDPNKTTLTDLDFTNIDNETKTIQLITT